MPDVFGETWAAVPGYFDLEVSDQGNARSISTWQPYKQCLSDGYPQIYATKSRSDGTSGGRKYLKVHRAVLMAFVGPPGRLHVACHGNDIRSDNRLSNLRWATQQDNINDAKRNGRMPRGEQCGSAVLRDASVRLMRYLNVIHGVDHEVISDWFEITTTACKQALYGRTWTHLPPQSRVAAT
jgi:hypothetical protein